MLLVHQAVVRILNPQTHDYVHVVAEKRGPKYQAHLVTKI